jgi:hypothetical protein
MGKRFVAALTILLAGHGSAFTQQYGSDPATPVWGPNPVNPGPVDVDAQPEASGFRGAAEYLLWWFKNGRVPPLVTAGGNGKLGSPGTQVLLDNLDVDAGVRQGGRFALAYQFETISYLGIEAGYFFLANRQSEARFSSDGSALLAQPFINAVTGTPDASLIADPGKTSGTVTVLARTSLWGAETNVAAALIRCEPFRLTALGGFRFLRLADDVMSVEQFQLSTNVPTSMGGGNKVTLQDEFRTINTFFGGQVGLEAGVQVGLVTIDFGAKLALGQMQEVAEAHGALNALTPNGTTFGFPGGLYALGSNSGRHQRDDLAFIPEVGLNVGLQVTRHLTVSAGYSFLWVSTVARAGEQIDPVVNTTQFPLRSGNGSLVGPARPALNFAGSDFWAQGVNVGLVLRY